MDDLPFPTLLSIFSKIQWLIQKLNMRLETDHSELIHMQLFSVVVCGHCIEFYTLLVFCKEVILVI